MNPMNLASPKIERHYIGTFFDAGEQLEGIGWLTADTCVCTSEDSLRMFRIHGSIFQPSSVEHVGSFMLRDLIPMMDIDRKIADSFAMKTAVTHKGVAFIAMESSQGAAVLGLPAATLLEGKRQPVGYAWVPSPDRSVGFMTIDPQTGHLLGVHSYMNAQCLHEYDVSSFYEALGHAHGKSPQLVATPTGKMYPLFKEDGKTPDTVGQIQGAVISPNGRLYLAWYSHPTRLLWTNYLAAYDFKTGVRTSRMDDIDFTKLRDEIEGIAFHPSGILYISVCINNPRQNDFDVYSLRSIDPDMPL